MKILNNLTFILLFIFSGYVSADLSNNTQMITREHYYLSKPISQKNLSIPNNYFSDKNLNYKIKIYQRPTDGTSEKLVVSQNFIYNTKNEIIKIIPFKNAPYVNIGNMKVIKNPRKGLINKLLEDQIIRYSNLSSFDKAFIEQNAKEIPIVLFNVKTKDGDEIINADFIFKFIKTSNEENTFFIELSYNASLYNETLANSLKVTYPDYLLPPTYHNDLFWIYYDRFDSNGKFNTFKLNTKDNFFVQIELNKIDI